MSPTVRRARQRAIEVRGARIPGSGGWKPYLLTLGALTLVWTALWGSVNPTVILLGIAVGALVLLLFPLPFMQFRFGVHPWRMLVLLLRFLGDVVVASLQVGWLALRPRPPRPEVTEVQLNSDSDLLQSLTALAVSLVPGSLIVDLDPEDRTLLIHVLDGERRPMSQFADQVRAQERRIQLALGDDSVTSNAPRRRAADAAGRRTDRRSEKRRDGRRESGGRR
jgi:multicomponent Na+:H+ antiporter subunit E